MAALPQKYGRLGKTDQAGKLKNSPDEGGKTERIYFLNNRTGCTLFWWYFDDLVKSLLSPQSAQRSQKKYFYFQQVISVGLVLSVVNFQFLRTHQVSAADPADGKNPVRGRQERGSRFSPGRKTSYAHKRTGRKT
ncbi:MAG: hypothetical protein M0P70_05485 [Desulfobulbaceae bacterium]|nr:hypothetical protein [Desulfobulbaceae bacterium]